MVARVGGVLYAHLQTWRPYTLCYPGLVGLAGATLPHADPSSAELVAAWAAPTLGWIGGHYLCDYFDRELDAASKPQRPIPSGRISPGTALFCGVTAAGAAIVVLALRHWAGAVAMAAITAGVLAYARALKGRGLWGNALRGTWMALILLAGVMTTHSHPPLSVLPLAMAFLAHDSAHNLLGTLRDVDGDREGGYTTLPVRHGPRAAARTAAALYAAALVAALAVLPLIPHDSWPGYLMPLAAAAGCGAAAFLPLLRSGERIGPAAALRAAQPMEAERLLLAGTVLSLGVDTALTAALVAAGVLYSLMTQRLMRARYDLPPATPSMNPLPIGRQPTAIPPTTP